MNAKQARKISEDNSNQAVSKWLLDFIYEKIKHAAESGNTSVLNPFAEINFSILKKQELQALWTYLIAEGYSVVHHTHPFCRGVYTEVSW